MADYQGQLFVRSLPPTLNNTKQDDLNVAMWYFNQTDGDWEKLQADNAGDNKAGDLSGLNTNSILYAYDGATHDRLRTEDAPAGTLGVLRINTHDGVNSTQVAVHNEASKTKSFQLLGYYTSDPTTNNKVDDGDSVRILTDDEGRIIAKLADPLSQAVTVADYDVEEDLAAAGTNNHVYTVTLPAGKTKFLLTGVMASSSGHLKIEVLTGESGSETTKAVLFNSNATPNVATLPNMEIEVEDGHVVKVIRTNVDHTATNVYSTILGRYVE